MHKTWRVRATPLLLTLGLLPGGVSLVSAPSMYSQLDPLPRAVGTYGATLGQGHDIPVQLWYPLADSAAANNNKQHVCCVDEIHHVVNETSEDVINIWAEQNSIDSAADRRAAAVTDLIKAMTTRAVDESIDVSPSVASGCFPLVIMAHGSGNATNRDYCSICEYMAAHGLIVAAVQNATSGTACSLEGWQSNIYKVIDCLKNADQDPSSLLASMGSRINFDRVGIIGHSYGGEAAVHAVASRAYPGVIKMGVGLDCSIRNNEDENNVTERPFLFVMMDARDSSTSPLGRLVVNNNKRSNGACELLDLATIEQPFKQANHSSFMDGDLLSSAIAAAVTPVAVAADENQASGEEIKKGNRGADAIRFYNLINKRLLEFFDKYL